MLVSCPNCEFSREIDDAQVPDWAKALKCPQCGQPISLEAEQSLEWLPHQVPEQPDASQENELTGIPLESGQGNFFSNFGLTIKMVLFRPSAFFEKMRPDGGYEMPIAFIVVLSFICSILGLIVHFAIRFGISELIGDPTSIVLRLLGPSPTPGSLFVSLIIVPLLMPVYMFIHAAIMDNFLPTIRAKKLGYQATYRVASYGMAASVFGIVPILGTLVAFVWGLVVTIIGLSRVYQTSTGSVVLAAVFPHFLYLLVVGGLAAMWFFL